MKNTAKILFVATLLTTAALLLILYKSMSQFIDFKVTSQVTGKELQITSRDKLIKYEQSMGFQKGARLAILPETTGKEVVFVPINKINIIYTDKMIQGFMQIKGPEGRVISSYGQSYDAKSKTMNLYIYVDKEVDGTDDVFSLSFENMVLQSLFQLSNLSKFPQAEVQTKMKDYMINYYKT